MVNSAERFLNNSKKKYSTATCYKCNHTAKGLLVCFKFSDNYSFWYMSHNLPPPEERFTIQDGHVICSKCCGFGHGRPIPTFRMEGHKYTWIDGTESECPNGYLPRKRSRDEDWMIRSIKKLKREVKALQHELRKNTMSMRARRSLHKRDTEEGYEV